jgi:hypothetical protein
MRLTKLLLLTLAFLSVTAGARAVVIDTVAFNPSGPVPPPKTSGSGTLAGGTIVVTYTTAAVGNAGLTFNDPMPALPPTTTGVTNQTAGVFGVTNTGTTETVTFSIPVLNPILIENFTDPNVTYTFSNPVTLLAQNNAQLAGNVLSFVGAGDRSTDGFSLQLTGTFSSFSFVALETGSGLNGSGIDTQAFTVSAAAATGVPEPSTFAAAGLMTLAGLAYRHRRRARAVATA